MIVPGYPLCVCVQMPIYGIITIASERILLDRKQRINAHLNYCCLRCILLLFIVVVLLHAFASPLCSALCIYTCFNAYASRTKE